MTAARNIRAQYRINPSARIRVNIKTPPAGWDIFTDMAEGIRQLTRAESLEVGPDIKKEKGSAASPVGEYEVVIPLAGVADLKAELKRLQKEKDKLEADLARTEKKLSNENFVAKAKESVVQKERDKAAFLKLELEKINESLQIIAGSDIEE